MEAARPSLGLAGTQLPRILMGLSIIGHLDEVDDQRVGAFP
jgi:hypothetical protein